jgi:Rod binding domain-containing protein
MDGIGLPTEPLGLGLLLPMGSLAEGRIGQGGPPLAAQKAARDFESVLVHKVLEEMSRTVGESGLLGSEMTGQVEGLFWFYLAQEVANKGGLGLWKEIYRQLEPPNATDRKAPAPELSK